MIKSLTVTNQIDESIKIVLGDSDNSGFLITNIEGLGPCKATINSTEMATGDGSIFNSSRLESRNIVISLVYNPYDKRSIEELRHLSYRYFPIKKKISLMFETELRNCIIDGYVESNEPIIFSPRSGTQISIICPDPYFQSYGDDGISETNFGGIDPVFEFPFSNESLTDPMIEFATIDQNMRKTVYYNGDSDVGVILKIVSMGSVGDIEIENKTTREHMTIYSKKIEQMTGTTITDNDEITISTLRNKKSITLLRSGISYNILNALDRNSDWIKLIRGDNTFVYSLSDGSAPIYLSVKNRTLYEGV